MEARRNIFPIPATKKIKYLEENWGALDIELVEKQIQRVRKVIEGTEVHCGRVKQSEMATLVKDTSPPLSTGLWKHRRLFLFNVLI